MQRHRFAAVSLIFGVLFTGLGVMFLQGDVDVWRFDWSWLWPVMLTLAGVLVLASALASRETAVDADADTLPPVE